VLGVTAVGLFLGRVSRERSDALLKPLGALQGAVLGVVGLVLAFGLALAIGRYELRRAAVVEEANTIGTTYLRAQTLAEPQRSVSLELLAAYTESSIRLSNAIPGSSSAVEVVSEGARLQRELWALAGQALDDAPTASAPRLYVESLNEMIDMRTTRVAGLGNRVPGPVLTLEIVAAALALGLLAFLAILGRGALVVVIAARLVSLLLLVTFDLDRPTRGLIRIPSTPLTSLRASMALPPAATGPTRTMTRTSGRGGSRGPHHGQLQGVTSGIARKL
jgi:hypothetical protein